MFFITFFVLAVANADILLDIYRENTDFSVDPCENFYRHACPLNLPDSKRIEARFTKIMRNGSNPTVVGYFNKRNSPVLNDFKTISEAAQADKDYSELVVEHYSEFCQKNYTAKKNYLWRNLGLGSRNKGKNCEDETNFISKFLDKNSNQFIRENLSILHDKVTASIFDDVFGGRKDVYDILEDIKNIFQSWVEETPWVLGSRNLEKYRLVVEDLSLDKYYGKRNAQRTYRALNKTDEGYMHCLKKLNSTTAETKLICLKLNLRFNAIQDFDDDDISNGRNMRTDRGKNLLQLGPIHYFLGMDNSNEASKLGFAGTLLSHEFSHTFVPSNTKSLFGKFSNNARQCITKQFNSTCSVFKEKPFHVIYDAYFQESCEANDFFLAENAADVLGYHLGYELFKQRFGSKLHENYPGTNATHQQLFFYGVGTRFCDGRMSSSGENTHSPTNIRVNSVVQLPAFKDAFKCSDSSKMIKIRTEECHIYGPLAPKF